MRKLIILISFVGIICSACNKSIPSCDSCSFNCISEIDNEVISSEKCPNEYECTFQIIKDSEIDYSSANGIVSGGKSFIIEIVSFTQGSVDIADDEFTNRILLEIPNNQESFDLDGENLELLKPSFQRICFCGDVSLKPFTSGCLQGELINDVWNVQGSLFIDYYANGSEMNLMFDFKVF